MRMFQNPHICKTEEGVKRTFSSLFATRTLLAGRAAPAGSRRRVLCPAETSSSHLSLNSQQTRWRIVFSQLISPNPRIPQWPYRAQEPLALRYKAEHPVHCSARGRRTISAVLTSRFVASPLLQRSLCRVSPPTSVLIA